MWILRSSLLFLSVLVGTLNGSGQVITSSPKAEKYFHKAKKAVRDKDADKAILYYSKAVDESPQFYEAQAQLAILLNRLGRESEALPALEKLISIDSLREPYVYFQLGKLQYKREHWSQAAPYLERFARFKGLDAEDQQMASYLAAECRFREFALAHPVPFDPVPFSAALNSAGDELNPTFTADGQTVVFTRYDGRQEDFYTSTWVDGAWKEATPLADLNTADNEGAHCLSKDGRMMVFTSCNNRNGLGSCDLYESHWWRGHWSEPVNLGPAVNSKHWDSQPTLSADGRLLIFSSKRPEGQGGADLWYSQRKPDGHWSVAQLLPGKIQSPGDDETPFLHADGQTLYFSSNGHIGMGLHDLFVSRLTADSSWSEPVNLGYPINTREQEQAITLSLDGQTAYFSSDRFTSKSKSNFDLFTFTLPQNSRGTSVTYVTGTVRSVASHQGLPATITFQCLDTPESSPLIGQADQDGQYLICLPAGKRYALLIDHPQYSFFSESFDLSDSLAFHPYQLDVDLYPIKKRQSEDRKAIVLQNILFASGSDELLMESTFELQKVLEFLRENPGIRIRIEGHTDNVGLPEDNLDLSTRRATSVVKWLLDHGISEDRLLSAGYGESRPLVENDTPAHRQMNRRTELVILP
ncbi:MAG: OmpA family protein [Saprospiraceae bacterium]|nr:OmpA family protein [Saprospiraceae bacterium]